MSDFFLFNTASAHFHSISSKDRMNVFAASVFVLFHSLSVLAAVAGVNGV